MTEWLMNDEFSLSTNKQTKNTFPKRLNGSVSILVYHYHFAVDMVCHFPLRKHANHSERTTYWPLICK